MSAELEDFRMDFIREIVSMDEDSRTVRFILRPDPRRYEWVDGDGERYLYDKLDDVCISEQALAKMAGEIKGMPILFEPNTLGEVKEYIESRRPGIRNKLQGNEARPTFEDKSEAFLESLVADKLGFAILSLDMVGSTKLATATDPKAYARLIATVLSELSEVVPRFRGHVLKYTGDGLIAYFPAPGFITKIDLSLDCALTLRRLVYTGINPAFEDCGLPPIAIRIGIDAGEAYVETVGSPETKQHKDIIGAVVSLASKIQALGKPGEILVGETAERLLYTAWRQVCEAVQPGDDWDYTSSSGRVYRVHRVGLEI